MKNIIAILIVVLFPLFANAGGGLLDAKKKGPGAPAEPKYSLFAISEAIERDWKKELGLIYVMRFETKDVYWSDPKTPRNMVRFLALVPALPMGTEMKITPKKLDALDSLEGLIAFEGVEAAMSQEHEEFRLKLLTAVKGYEEPPKPDAGEPPKPDAGEPPKPDATAKALKWITCLKATFPQVRKDMVVNTHHTAIKQTYCLVKVTIRAVGNAANAKAVMDADLATLQDVQGMGTKEVWLNEKFGLRKEEARNFPDNSVILENHPLIFPGLLDTFREWDNAKGNPVNKEAPEETLPTGTTPTLSKLTLGLVVYWLGAFWAILSVYLLVIAIGRLTHTIHESPGKPVVIGALATGIVVFVVLVIWSDQPWAKGINVSLSMLGVAAGLVLMLRPYEE